jgi:hypothetical protein
VQTNEAQDQNALAILKLRQQLLERQLHKVVLQRRTPLQATPTVYDGSLAPVVAMCREQVLEFVDAIFERFSFRPSLEDVARSVPLQQVCMLHTSQHCIRCVGLQACGTAYSTCHTSIIAGVDRLIKRLDTRHGQSRSGKKQTNQSQSITASNRPKDGATMQAEAALAAAEA